MADKNCAACNDLKEYAPNFVVNGITDKECKSLQNDTGLNPNLKVLHNDCEDLNDLNDCLIGSHGDKIDAYDVCEWKEYEVEQNKNLWNMFKALICAICGIWKNIHDLWNKIKELENILIKDGYITVTKIYSYTVPKAKFVDTGNPHIDMWWSGSVELGESYITIPVSEMDIVDTVMAQPQVVGNRVHGATVAIQSAEKVGNNYIVNFDSYEIRGSYFEASNFPYELPIKFVVVGRKKVR